MPRYKIQLVYNGKNYFGFQVQPKRLTIQAVVEAALKRILREKIKITASGRTDTGVHALGQVCHFDVNSQKAICRINKEDIIYKINSVLPKDIQIISFKKCHKDFHACYHAKFKKYVYYILLTKNNNPFIGDFLWCVHTPLDQKAMKKAATYLLGTHDFKAFCASDSAVKSKVREIKSIKFSNKKLSPVLAIKGESYLCIEFLGTGFLKQMVRNMVGTLVAVGQHKIQPHEIKGILKSRDRKKAFVTAPPQGLFLKEVGH